jgi:PST family polysaccharide transporter
MFFKFQKLVGMLVIPLGIGIFCFRDLITQILLGSQWSEASNFIGLWGLTSAFTIVLSHYSSEVYRSLGKPKLSVLAQILHIVALCPAMLIAVKYDWDVIYITRAIIRLELVLVNLAIMYYAVRISPRQMIGNIMPSTIAGLLMGVLGLALLSTGSSTIWSLTSVLICTAAYILIILLFKDERAVLLNFIERVKNKK